MGPIRNPNRSTSGMRVTLSYLTTFIDRSQDQSTTNYGPFIDRSQDQSTTNYGPFIDRSQEYQSTTNYGPFLLI